MAERAKGEKKNGAGKAAKSLRKALRAPKPGEAGHNSGVVPDEVYDRHLKKIDLTAKALDKAKEVYDQARGVHRSAFKAAKDDGVNIDAVRLARKLDKLDLGVVATDYSDTGRVLRLMKSPLAEQLNLFADVAPPAPVNPVLAGEHAGKNNAPSDENPYSPGSEPFQMWHDGWLRGQTSIAQEMQ